MLGIGYDDFTKLHIVFDDPFEKNEHSIKMGQKDPKKRKAGLDLLRSALQDGIRHSNSRGLVRNLRMDSLKISGDVVNVKINMHKRKARQKAVR